MKTAILIAKTPHEVNVLMPVKKESHRKPKVGWGGGGVLKNTPVI